MKIDKEKLQVQLQDLGEHGIHLHNSGSRCFLCGKSTKDYAGSSRAIDQVCRDCDGNDAKLKAVYTAATVFVKQVLNDRRVHISYGGIVKIDSKLYQVTLATGSSCDLTDLVTGERIHSGYLGKLYQHVFEKIYHEQAEKMQYAYVLEFYWPAVKDVVSSQVWNWVSWAQGVGFYDIGHCGRGIEDAGRVYVRLYVRPPDKLRQRELNLVAVQVINDRTAGYLDNFETAPFPESTAILQWNQAGELLTQALLGINHEYINRGYARTLKEYQGNVTSNPSMPTDWWLVIQVERDRYSDDRPMDFRLEDLMILSRPAKK